MPRALSSPDRLFDRTWRPGHPFRPRLSRLRRFGMIALFISLSLVIGGYWWVTDSVRVRDMAQRYLSRLVGGRVTVGSATLSIFQGLRLNDVRVYVDETMDDRSLLFRAQSLALHADPTELMRGNLEATQIVAIEPYVKLAEEPESGTWNYQRLKLLLPKGPKNPNAGPPALPEIILRNAIIENVQLDKTGAERIKRGTMTIEGQLKPTADAGVYGFSLQSRGATEGIGPSVEGEINFTGSDPTFTARLMNFRFGSDLETMLPAIVRQWWRNHQLAGRVDVPVLTFRPSTSEQGGPGTFRAEIDLRGVQMIVDPHEWQGADEARREQWERGALDVMRAAGLDESGFVADLEDSVQPSPITLHQVTGKFVFTETRVDVQNVSGYVESNGLKIDGHIVNYAQPSEATASIRVSSLTTDDILIPASPRYINSMPQVVKEIYDHLRPQGRCRFWVQMDRPDPNGRPDITGEVSIIDGQFIFDEFPYPVTGASGKLVIGRNKETNAEQLEIIDIRGHGPSSGPNRDARVRINGRVSPFGAETGVRVTVVGDDIRSEPTLFHSLPLATQKALKLFDAPGKGQFPIFRGGFTCEIERPPELVSRWLVMTKIRLDEATGVLEAFPYPMSGVRGELTVYDDRLHIDHATMNRADGATLQIDGDVRWSTPADRQRRLAHERERERLRALSLATGPTSQETDDPLPPLKTDLRITAANVPVDEQLLAAMPDDQRAWMKKLGITGKFDLEGRVMPVAKRRPTDSETGFDFKIALHDASVSPMLIANAATNAGTFSAVDVGGTLRLTSGKVDIESIHGKRGDADLAVRGSVDWAQLVGHTQVALSVDAKNLALDPALYAVLPDDAKKAWDQVRPNGSIDAAITYSGVMSNDGVRSGGSSTTESVVAPATQLAISASDSSGVAPIATIDASTAIATTEPTIALSSTYQITLTPRELSALPTAVPYRLDGIAGQVTISSDKVLLQNLTAHHGNAKVKIAAVGSLGGDASAWDMQLSADDVLVDDDFRAALPKALADLTKSLKLSGKIGFDFDKLALTSPPRTVTATNPGPKTKPGEDPPLDVDFAVKLKLDDASADVGVPIAGARGLAQLAGVSKNGSLQQLQGAVDLDTLTLAGMPAENLRFAILKQPDRDVLRIGKLEARIADGELAGQFDCTLGDAAPTRYAAALVLRNADVRPLTSEAAPDLRGRLSASLAIEGAFNDSTSRRGRGDVSVTGESMYRIPLLLGLLQITNLSMPVTSPFNEATARYSLDGNRVTFETIELRAKDMLMQGSGHLDFASKQVRLTFVTDSTAWNKVPIIGDLLQGARHELLQIHVKGSLKEPKVSAGAFSTVTTTVDEVLKGNDPGERKVK